MESDEEPSPLTVKVRKSFHSHVSSPELKGQLADKCSWCGKLGPNDYSGQTCCADHADKLCSALTKTAKPAPLWQ